MPHLVSSHPPGSWLLDPGLVSGQQQEAGSSTLGSVWGCASLWTCPYAPFTEGLNEVIPPALRKRCPFHLRPAWRPQLEKLREKC